MHHNRPHIIGVLHIAAQGLRIGEIRLHAPLQHQLIRKAKARLLVMWYGVVNIHRVQIDLAELMDALEIQGDLHLLVRIML